MRLRGFLRLAGPVDLVGVPAGQDGSPVTRGHRYGDAVAMRNLVTPRSPWLAIAFAVVTLVLLATMVVVRETDPAGAVAVALGLGVTAGVGSLVASRRPDHPTGWLLAGLAVLAAASVVVIDYVQSSASSGTPRLAVVAGWLSTWLATPLLPLGALLLLTFPTGRLPSRRWRVVAIVAVVAGVVQAGMLAVAPGPVPVAPWLDNPLGLVWLGPVAEAIGVAAGTVAAGVVLAAIVRLLVHYRHTSGQERGQLRLVAAALPVTVLGLVAAAVAEGPLNEASFYLAVVGLTAIPVAIGWAVLRHGLFDIDLLINRALVFSLLTATVLLVYVGLVLALGSLLRQPVELGVSLVATGVVAVMFAPIRDRLQHGVDRLMYGERSDPYAALSGLGRRLEEAATPDQVLPTTAEVLGASLKLEAVEIEALTDKEFRRVASWGAAAAAPVPVRLELVHGRELVGRLSVWPRQGETLAARDRALLTDLCRPVAVAVHAAQVDRALQISRSRLVTTREEERRRLRADLHDGLGPHLAGVGLSIGAARNVLARDPRSAEQLLSSAQRQLRDTVTTVRSLVEGLAPAVEQLGLAPALCEGAHRLTAPAGVDLDLDVAELPRLPAAVELAAYRIAMEAVTNAVRHAAPTRCCLRLRLEDGLQLSVVDDGRGLPATIVPGVGLISMRQRAAEVGGTCHIEPAADGGTRVRAELPVG
jgi:signal transduction histidine kinase